MALARYRPAAALPSSLNRRTRRPAVPTKRNGAIRRCTWRSASWLALQAPPGVVGSPQRTHPAGRSARLRRQTSHSDATSCSPSASPHAAQAGGMTASSSAPDNCRQSRRTTTIRRSTSGSGPNPVNCGPIRSWQPAARSAQPAARRAQPAARSPQGAGRGTLRLYLPGRAIRRARSREVCLGWFCTPRAVRTLCT